MYSLIILLSDGELIDQRSKRIIVLAKFTEHFQLKRRSTSNFMETVQQEINESMRSILVDWLIEVMMSVKLLEIIFDELILF